MELISMRNSAICPTYMPWRILIISQIANGIIIY
jgi:hypothetical protein